MLHQTYLLFIRTLTKDKVFGFVNLFNLIIGFSAFFLVSMFLNEELSWDKHNSKYNDIYRLQFFMDQSENVIKHSSSVTAAISRQVLPGLPEIEKIALIHDVGDNNKDGIFLSADKKNQFLIRWGYYSDQSVFDIFSFHFTAGDPANALVHPLSIVLSEDIAGRLFPEGNALGKVVYLENKKAMTVTGIYRDLPYNSTWRPVYIIPMSSFSDFTGWLDYETNYWAYSFFTYVLLKKDTDPASIDRKIKDSLKDYRKEHQPYLRPLSVLHLNPYYDNAYYIGLGLVTLIGFLILGLSSINYINLQTANATTRLKEIGVKKTFGFSRRNLLFQFTAETLFISVIAAISALIITQMALPVLNWIMGTEIFHSILEYPDIIAIIFTISLVTGLISGIFPAIVISSFSPVGALRQKILQEKNGNLSLKKALMVIQFSISVFLLIISLIISRQAQYMIHRDMGFDSKNVLYSNIVTNKTGSLESIRSRLLNHPEITDISFSDYIPFILPGGDDLSLSGQASDEKVFIRTSNISYDFISTFKIGMSQGRNFSREFPADIDKCLINETAVRVFNWDEPVGRTITVRGKTYEVIGVMKDYIAFSVNNMIEPHFYALIPDTAHLSGIYSISFRPGSEKTVLKLVSDEFTFLFPDDAFEFKSIDTLIRNENAVKVWKSFNKLTGSVTILSILIAAVGLFGLVLFMTRRRLKEIGIKKVFGFSNLYLYFHLSAGYMKLLLISLVFAWPSAYYIYNILPGAYKPRLEAWVFIVPSVIILIISMITISTQMIQTARIRPTEILRDE